MKKQSHIIYKCTSQIYKWTFQIDKYFIIIYDGNLVTLKYKFKHILFRKIYKIIKHNRLLFYSYF